LSTVLERLHGGRSQLRRHAVNGLAKARWKVRHPRVSVRVAPTEDMLDNGTLHLYFEIGASAMEQIRDGLRVAASTRPRRVLDLPSGHGRVLRHMRAAWPDAEFTAMDLQHHAVRFCERAFGARPVFSRDPLWSVDAGGDFDLIWSGSLLTHFDRDYWVPVLRYFRDRLSPEGTLVFSTHGDLPIASLEGERDAVARLGPLVGEYGLGARARDIGVTARQTGFAFATYPETAHLHWGVSFSTPDWVRQKVDEVGGLDLIRHVPAGWFGHHDVWTFARSGSSE
jgi:SAM-dependent methyltransferase